MRLIKGGMDKGWKWEKEGRVQSEKKGSAKGGKSGYELKVGKKGRGLRVGKRGWARDGGEERLTVGKRGMVKGGGRGYG